MIITDRFFIKKANLNPKHFVLSLAIIGKATIPGILTELHPAFSAWFLHNQ